MKNSNSIDKNRRQFESNDDLAKLDDRTVSCGVGCTGKEDEEEDVPKWAHFICPSCGISYGISSLVKAIRRRRCPTFHETSDAS